MSNFSNLTGLKFGRLRVLARAEDDTCGKPRWRCMCDCGQVTVARGIDLRLGGARSCGCSTRISQNSSAESKELIGEIASLIFGLATNAFILMLTYGVFHLIFRSAFGIDLPNPLLFLPVELRQMLPGLG